MAEVVASLERLARLGVTPQGTGMPEILEANELVAWTAAHFPDPTPTDELLARFGLPSSPVGRSEGCRAVRSGG